MNLEAFGELLVNVVVAILLVMPVAGLVATVYIWRLWRSDTRRPRSWVLFAMAYASTVIDFMSVPIAWFAWRRVINAEPLPSYVALLILGGVLLVLEAVPVYFGVLIYRKRRGIRGSNRTDADV